MALSDIEQRLKRLSLTWKKTVWIAFATGILLGMSAVLLWHIFIGLP